VLSSLPRHHNNPLAKCGCKKQRIDFHGDHTATCAAHSGATKAHGWMFFSLGPLFRTAGHTVRTQPSVTASAGQRRGDVEICNYLRDQAVSRSLDFDLSITHDRFGSSSHVQQNCLLSHDSKQMRLCVLLRSARSTPVGNNTLTIRTFLFSPPLQAHPPACMANFCVFFFYRPTGSPRRTSLQMECHRNATTKSDSFRFKRAAFYQSLKSKVGLAAAKAAALQINLNVEGCGIVAAPVHAPSRAPLLLPLLLSHNLPFPRVH